MTSTDPSNTVTVSPQTYESVARSPREQQSPLVDEIPPEMCHWSCPECDRSGYVASTGLEVAQDEGLYVVCVECGGAADE